MNSINEKKRLDKIKFKAQPKDYNKWSQNKSRFSRNFKNKDMNSTKDKNIS